MKVKYLKLIRFGKPLGHKIQLVNNYENIVNDRIAKIEKYNNNTIVFKIIKYKDASNYGVFQNNKMVQLDELIKEEKINDIELVVSQ